MKKIIAALLISLLAACTSIVKVEGDQTVQGKMSLRLPDAWNKVQLAGNQQPFDMWTQEGLTVDALRLWAGIASNQELIKMPATSVPVGGKAARVPTFVAGMPPDQLVNLFETMYSADGSIVTMSKVEPVVFAGERGVRFEFTMVRKSDDVTMRGVGWVAVKKDQLYAATFVAPRLSFFPRLLPKAESVVKTAAIKA